MNYPTYVNSDLINRFIMLKNFHSYNAMTLNGLITKLQGQLCKEEQPNENHNQKQNFLQNYIMNQSGFSAYGSDPVVKESESPSVESLKASILEVKQETEDALLKAEYEDQTTCSPNSNSNSNSMSSQSKKIKKQSSRKRSKENEESDDAPRKKKAFWSQEEDAKAVALLAELGPKWTKVGKMIGGRTGKQVRDRYLGHLKPNISFEKWTEEEDALIIALYDKFGSRWLQIAEHLPHRTNDQVKNRYNGKLVHQLNRGPNEQAMKMEVNSNYNEDIQIKTKLEENH